jgi:hypothetical protein
VSDSGTALETAQADNTLDSDTALETSAEQPKVADAVAGVACGVSTETFMALVDDIDSHGPRILTSDELNELLPGEEFLLSVCDQSNLRPFINAAATGSTQAPHLESGSDGVYKYASWEIRGEANKDSIRLVLEEIGVGQVWCRPGLSESESDTESDQSDAEPDESDTDESDGDDSEGDDSSEGESNDVCMCAPTPPFLLNGHADIRPIL